MSHIGMGAIVGIIPALTSAILFAAVSVTAWALIGEPTIEMCRDRRGIAKPMKETNLIGPADIILGITMGAALGAIAGMLTAQTLGDSG